MTTTDTRSIGQVLYEMSFPPRDGWTKWERVPPEMREPYERAAEVIFKRGFDAGVEFQKKAAPTPKAKQYRDVLREMTGALADLHCHSQWDPDGELTQEEFDALGNAASTAIAKAEAVLK